MSAMLLSLAMTLVACSSLTDATPPSNLVSQSTGETQAGAVALYQGALTLFSQMFGADNNGRLGSTNGVDPSYFNYTETSGLFSDELGGTSDAYDSRNTTNLTENPGLGPYTALHTTRLTIARALVALGQYQSTLPPSYRGEMHALQGYISILLAELYCSGVPFTHLDNGGVLVYGMPESSTQMYQDAIAQFDSATAIATDSVRIQQLAAIGKARALLDLGEYDSAATAAAGVPASYAYNVNFSSAHNVAQYWAYIGVQLTTTTNNVFGVSYMADMKGGNGLNFVSAADPRLTLQATPSSRGYYPYNYATFTALPGYLPAKFSAATDLPIPLATGIEGQLIVAEAALKRGDASWLTTLNTLRSSVSGLTALNDPMIDTARVSLLFRERAFWMYGTGHRTGDLRRLVRQYERPENAVFPTGTYIYTYPTPIYGTQMNLEPPQSEGNNPNYHGCLSRDA